MSNSSSVFDSAMVREDSFTTAEPVHHQALQILSCHGLLKLPVVIYRYSASPYAQKIDHILSFKKIPHFAVKVNYILPRPEISDLLGIAYRRVPVLAIGNDVYCDTNLIATVLERRFPSSNGYETLFPPRKGNGKVDASIIQAFSKYYIDHGVFPAGFGIIPWDRMKPDFIQDRMAFINNSDLNNLDVSDLINLQSQRKSILSSHADLINKQLADGREWLFDTESPSLADISVYFMFAWISTMPAKNWDGLAEYPHMSNWLSRMSSILKSRNLPPLAKPITGAEAAKLISASPFESPDIVGFDAGEAVRLGVTQGRWVAITPEDTGTSHPTVGKLVGLNKEEFVIETQGSVTVVRCHFPRLGYTISLSNVPGNQSKL